MATIGTQIKRHRNPFWHWWTPWRPKWIEERVPYEHIIMSEAIKALGFLQKESCFLDKIPWFMEEKHMDMEMKKNLAAMIQLENEPGPYVYATRSSCIERNERFLNWLDEKGFLQEPTAKAETPIADLWESIKAKAKGPEPTNTAMLKIEYPETYDDFSTFMSGLNALVQEFTPALDQTQMVIMLRTEANLIEYAELQGRILRGDE